jgi:predicted phosphoribosyltransferase
VRDLALPGVEVVCPVQPGWLRAVSLHYDDFAEVTTEEAAELLAASRGAPSP